MPVALPIGRRLADHPLLVAVVRWHPTGCVPLGRGNLRVGRRFCGVGLWRWRVDGAATWREKRSNVYQGT